MAASITEIHESLKTWLLTKVRIDKWTVDMPSTAVTTIGGKQYPANTGAVLPIERVDFYRSDAGAICEANFYFKIIYRFVRKLPYHNLPLATAEGILNNIYYDALNNPGNINSSILEVNTPEIGTDVVVRAMNEGDTTSDWLIILQPAFRIKFRVKLADVGPLQPGDGDGPTYEFNSLTIGIYRSPIGDVGDEDESRLDRTILIEPNP